MHTRFIRYTSFAASKCNVSIKLVSLSLSYRIVLNCIWVKNMAEWMKIGMLMAMIDDMLSLIFVRELSTNAHTTTTTAVELSAIFSCRWSPSLRAISISGTDADFIISTAQKRKWPTIWINQWPIFEMLYSQRCNKCRMLELLLRWSMMSCVAIQRHIDNDQNVSHQTVIFSVQTFRLALLFRPKNEFELASCWKLFAKSLQRQRMI